VCKTIVVASSKVMSTANNEKQIGRFFIQQPKHEINEIGSK